MNEPTIQQLFDLTGKVALVTGGTGHLGSSISRALAEAGATVVISSRERSRAQNAAAQLPTPGAAEHFGVQLDHLDEASLKGGFEETLRSAGQLDILINNGQGGDAHDLTDVTKEQFDRQMANATGYFLLARLSQPRTPLDSPGWTQLLALDHDLQGAFIAILSFGGALHPRRVDRPRRDGGGGVSMLRPRPPSPPGDWL